jgi:hypothetical protein
MQHWSLYIPNSKHQITNKSQIPISNDQNKFGPPEADWSFGFVCYLAFVICNFHKPRSRLTLCSLPHALCLLDLHYEIGIPQSSLDRLDPGLFEKFCEILEIFLPLFWGHEEIEPAGSALHIHPINEEVVDRIFSILICSQR